MIAPCLQIASESAPAHAADASGILIIFTIALLVLNAFFVAAEFALIAVRRSRVEELVNKGAAGARSLKRALDDLDRYIAANQVGITLASVGLGVFGEPLFAGILVNALHALPDPLNRIVSHAVASAVAFFVVTFITVVVGEQLPKSLALRYSERFALLLVYPLRGFMFILSPFVSLVNGSTNLLLKLLRLPVSKGHSITVDELRYVVEQAEESGVMGAHAADVVRGALRFPNTVVRQVMVHRQDVEAIDADSPILEIYKSAARAKHTRVPVFKGTIDRVIGMLHIKELLKHDPANLDIHTILRPVLWVTADTPIPELVNALRRKRTRLALVTDEYGAFRGLVTLEDAAEVVLGEVLDEHEQPRSPIPSDPGGRFVVMGSTRLLDLQDALDHEFGERAVTVGGFLVRHLGRLPEPGERVEAEGYVFDVESVAGTQIGKIYCSIQKPADGGDATGTS